MQILVAAAANCQKIGNLEVPNPNPTPFEPPEEAGKCTDLYLFAKKYEIKKVPVLNLPCKNSNKESLRNLDTGLFQCLF